MKISVIIPVYNAENYLEAALLSVMNQTLTDIEIILVNDGSTDGSRAIIEKYAAIDSRIVVINKENQGVALARADGVAISKGDYIQTMDNDDYMYPYALERLYNRAIETDADMVVGRALFHIVEHDREEMDPRIDFDVITGIELIRLISNQKACWATWTRLHKATIYRDQEILTSPLVNRAEDVYLTSQLCYFAKKVVAIDETIIMWNIRTSSLSNCKSLSGREIDELIALPALLEDFFRSKGLSKELEDDIIKLRASFYQIRFFRGKLKDAYRMFMNIRKIIEIKPEIRNYMEQKMVKLLDTYYQNRFLCYVRIIKYHKKSS